MSPDPYPVSPLFDRSTQYEECEEVQWRDIKTALQLVILDVHRKRVGTVEEACRQLRLTVVEQRQYDVNLNEWTIDRNAEERVLSRMQEEAHKIILSHGTLDYGALIAQALYQCRNGWAETNGLWVDRLITKNDKWKAFQYLVGKGLEPDLYLQYCRTVRPGRIATIAVVPQSKSALSSQAMSPHRLTSSPTSIDLKVASESSTTPSIFSSSSRKRSATKTDMDDPALSSSEDDSGPESPTAKRPRLRMPTTSTVQNSGPRRQPMRSTRQSDPTSTGSGSASRAQAMEENSDSEGPATPSTSGSDTPSTSASQVPPWNWNDRDPRGADGFPDPRFYNEYSVPAHLYEATPLYPHFRYVSGRTTCMLSSAVPGGCYYIHTRFEGFNIADHPGKSLNDPYDPLDTNAYTVAYRYFATNTSATTSSTIGSSAVNAPTVSAPAVNTPAVNAPAVNASTANASAVDEAKASALERQRHDSLRHDQPSGGSSLRANALQLAHDFHESAPSNEEAAREDTIVVQSPARPAARVPVKTEPTEHPFAAGPMAAGLGTSGGLGTPSASQHRSLALRTTGSASNRAQPGAALPAAEAATAANASTPATNNPSSPAASSSGRPQRSFQARSTPQKYKMMRGDDARSPTPGRGGIRKGGQK